MGLSVERPLRSDARRNRARLIEVAAAAFRDEGLDIGVDEIARRAGVGIATLYRHFPAKTDLIVAVMDPVFDDLGQAAADALAGPREEALSAFLYATLSVQCHNRGFLEAFARHELPTDVRDALGRRALAILEPIVALGHETGSVRPELDASDLLMIVRMLGVVTAAPRRGTPETYVETLLRGLRR
jgi:AcrR family transcriptional regulator